MDTAGYAVMWRAAQVCCGADSTLAAGMVGDAVAAAARRPGGGTQADAWQAFCRLVAQRLPAATARATAGVSGLHRAVCDLPRDQRLAIALLDVAGLEARAAADAAGMSRGTLARLRRQALRTLDGRRSGGRTWWPVSA